jgi:hypothetical protein
MNATAAADIANVIDLAAVRAARAGSVAARIQAETPDWSARFAELTAIWARGRVPAQPAAKPAPSRQDDMARRLENLCRAYRVPT